MRRRTAFLTAVAVAMPLAVPAVAAADTVDAMAVTTTEGTTLTMTGTGLSLSLTGAPGTWSAATGGAALAVSDLRGTDNGWRITAGYTTVTSELVTTLGLTGVTGTNEDLGGDKIQVSSSLTLSGSGGTGTDYNVVTDQPLGASTVVVAKPNVGYGAGATTIGTSYKVQVPSTATVGDVFEGAVTYTLVAGRS